MTVAASASHRTARGASIEVCEERMDIISAYRVVGTFRGDAVISGRTHKTVRRVIARPAESSRISRARCTAEDRS